MNEPVLPRARRLPLIPRPVGQELSGSYLTRVAVANRAAPLTFLRLLGRVPPSVPAAADVLAGCVVTLNDAAFARLQVFTGFPGERLMRAVPALVGSDRDDGGPAVLHCSRLRAETIDCPECVLRRGGARLDTRRCPHRVACLRHGTWLHGDAAGTPLEGLAPEVVRAQRRFAKLRRHRGAAPAAHAYRTALNYLVYQWPMVSHTPDWYFELIDRWQQRMAASGRPQSPHGVRRLPSWLLHPETVVLAVVFADPVWAERSISRPDRSHKLFYERLLRELGLQHHLSRLRTVRSFTPLPEEIHAQARFGRLISDLDWGAPEPVDGAPRPVPFIDITADYEQGLRAAGVDGLARRPGAVQEGP